MVENSQYASTAAAKRDWTTLLLLPLVTAAIAAFTGAYANVIAPKWFGERREVTISTRRSSSAPMNGTGDTVLDARSAYLVTIANSGSAPIRKLPITIVADSSDSTSKLQVNHVSTWPPVEFGRLDQDSTKLTRRFVIDLFNPGDTLRVSVTALHARNVATFAKSEGVAIHETADSTLPAVKSERKSSGLSALFGTTTGVITAMIGWLIKLSLVSGGSSGQHDDGDKDRPFDRTPIGRKRDQPRRRRR